MDSDLRAGRALGDPADRTEAENALPAPVAEEERLLGVVLAAAGRMTQRRQTEDYDAELIRLRDSLADERLAEDQASVLEQMERVSHLAAQRARTQLGALDASSPYFGHLRLEDEHGRRDVLIGRHTCIAEGIRIVDWRNAPISKLYYQCREGDEYVVEIAGRELEGRVLLRRAVTIEKGELKRVATPNETFVRHADGWRRADHGAPALKGGAGTAATPERTAPLAFLGRTRGGAPARVDKHLPEIASLLDAAQFNLSTRPDSGVVAIQGSAGSGKTTVALHRVAYLIYQDPQRFSPKRSLVVVLSPGLARYIDRVLPALGVDGVPVLTYDAWARELRMRHFPRLPRLYAEHTPAVVSRFKRHGALLKMLVESARGARARTVVSLFDDLLTSRQWIEDGLARHAPGAFTAGEVSAVHDWCSTQHYLRAEGGGPNEDDVPTLDPEDDTILLRLYQLLVGPLQDRFGDPYKLSQLVVDEVQDFSPLELRVLLDVVPDGRPVTFAGDTAQQIALSSDFGDWARTLRELDLVHVEVSPLRVSYRSTRPIMEVARAVLGPLAPPEDVVAPRDGAPVELFRFAGKGEMVAFLADALHQLTANEPTANVAVLCADERDAAELHAALARADLPTLRHVAEYDFSFAPGIEVTDIRQAKGLEFDYVMIADADATRFPVTDAARRLLHVGLTRAAHQCWILCVATPSRLLPDSLLSRA
jgi:DNA helicase-2/ATP-dependent DNA helicase PcrA